MVIFAFFFLVCPLTSLLVETLHISRLMPTVVVVECIAEQGQDEERPDAREKSGVLVVAYHEETAEEHKHEGVEEGMFQPSKEDCPRISTSNDLALIVELLSLPWPQQGHL